MNRIKLIYIIPILIVLPSCATLNQSECLNTDWKALGLKDGENGRTSNYVQKHRKACIKHGIIPNSNHYQTGNKIGIEKYCAGIKGFWLGESGQDYKDVCPIELKNNHLNEYEKGKQMFLIMTEID